MKYVVLGLFLISIASMISVSQVGYNKKDNIKDIFDDQLSLCQERAPAYVGLSEKDASDLAIKENRQSRIIMKDDVSFPVTEDYSPSRINFEMKDGVVTKANCG